jgi:hypothetical protein
MVAEIKYGKGNSKAIMSKNLNIRNLCTKVVLKNWNDEKKQKVYILRKLKSDASFLSRVVTYNETWMFHMTRRTTFIAMEISSLSRTKEDKNITIKY